MSVRFTAEQVWQNNRRRLFARGLLAGGSQFKEQPKQRGMTVASPARESFLHDEIREFCRARGWLAIHSRMDKPTTQANGVSDFIIATFQDVYFIECKRAGEKPTKAQMDFGAHVKHMGRTYAVVHNMDEFREAIPEARKPI